MSLETSTPRQPSDSEIAAAVPHRRSLWRQGDFMKLWTGQSISQFGDEITLLAIPLLAIEILAVPAVVGLLSRLTTRDVALTAMVGFLALGLGWNTLTMDWGRIPMPSGRAIPAGSVTALQDYDTIIVADTQPLSYVPTAVGGRAENGNRPVWLGKPFTEPDRQRGLERLRPGRVGVLVRADYGDTLAFAKAAAEWYDIPAPRACEPVSVPLGDPMAICPVRTAPRF